MKGPRTGVTLEKYENLLLSFPLHVTPLCHFIHLEIAIIIKYQIGTECVKSNSIVVLIQALKILGRGRYKL